MEQREKYLDAVLAYFLLETQPISTLESSRFFDLLTPKSKSIISHPVSQLITEVRKRFNRNFEIHHDLQDNVLPEIGLLKQSVKESIRLWVQSYKDPFNQRIASLEYGINSKLETNNRLQHSLRQSASSTERTVRGVESNEPINRSIRKHRTTEEDHSKRLLGNSIMFSLTN